MTFFAEKSDFRNIIAELSRRHIYIPLQVRTLSYKYKLQCSYKLLDGKSLRALYLRASGKLQGCVESTIVGKGWFRPS